MTRPSSAMPGSLLFFLGWTFGFSWLIWLPVVLGHQGAIPVSFDTHAGMLAMLGFFGPAVGACAALYKEGGVGAVTAHFRRLTNFRIGHRWWLAVIGLPLLIQASAHFLPAVWGETVVRSFVSSAGQFIVIALMVTLLGGGQEELGWRSYLLDRLQGRYTAFTASLVLGTVWAVWHIPLWFMPGTSQGLISFPAFLLVCLSFSVILTWIYNNTAGSMTAAILAHGTMNAGHALLPVIIPWASSQPLYWYWALMLAVTAIVIVAVKGPARLAGSNHVRKSGILLAALLLFVTVAGGATRFIILDVLPYAPIRPHRQGAEERRMPDGTDRTPSTEGLQWEPFCITVEDTLALKGWFIHADGPKTVGTVIVLHGSSGCKEWMISQTRILASAGLNSVLFDLRAHGESGGTNCTFGYYEKRDVSRVIDSLQARYKDCGPIGIFGTSLGGAIALQAMAADRRISAGVACCPFTSLRSVVYDYMVHYFHIPFRWVSNTALDRSGEIAAFPVDSVSPLDMASSIEAPVLVIHGDADQNITWQNGEAIVHRLRAPGSEWYLIHGAGHDDIPEVGGIEYRRRVTSFLSGHLGGGLSR